MVVAAYVLLKAWTNTPLNIQAILVFLSGVVKCGQRVWVLWFTSSEKFRESMLSLPDPSPNYVRYMEEYNSKKDEGFKVSLEKLIRFPIEVENSYMEPVNNPLDNLEILQYAYGFFETVKRIISNNAMCYTMLCMLDRMRKEKHRIRTENTRVTWFSLIGLHPRRTPLRVTSLLYKSVVQ